jgi:RNA polymerase sigma factor (sigma-70 family)
MTDPVLNCLVPDEGTADAQIGENKDSGPPAFVTTRWSVVLTAQGESAAADEAVDKLCRIYWWPLYEFVRRQGHHPQEAQDLTQGFFAHLLERRDLDAVRREKGRLRSYLLASLKHFISNARRRDSTIKRGEGVPLLSLDELCARERTDLEPAHSLSAERVYERRWAATLLERVFARLGQEYRESGRGALFDQFEQLLTNQNERTSHARIAEDLIMTENAVNQAFHRYRQRYRELLHEEIAHTVAMPGDIQDELQHLVRVLRE